LKDQLAAQLGHALQQLIGARDHDFALLGAALGDGRLLGQPLALGLHGVGFGRRVGPGFHLEGRQQLLGVGEVAAREGGGGHGRIAHIGGLLAQRVDLGGQQIGLLGACGNTVELARPQVYELAERTLRRRHRLGGCGDADQEQREPCEAD